MAGRPHQVGAVPTPAIHSSEDHASGSTGEWWEALSLFFASIIAIIFGGGLLIVGLLFAVFMIRAIFTT